LNDLNSQFGFIATHRPVTNTAKSPIRCTRLYTRRAHRDDQAAIPSGEVCGQRENPFHFLQSALETMWINSVKSDEKSKEVQRKDRPKAGDSSCLTYLLSSTEKFWRNF